MANKFNTVLGFELEYFEEFSGIVQVMYLKYFVQDNTIEILQQSNNKAFLKRILYPNVQLKDLFIGGSLTIHSRVYIIRKYANSATERYMTAKETHFLVVSNSMATVAKIIKISQKMDLVLGSIRTNDASTHFECDGIIVSGSSILVEIVGLTASKSDLYQEFYSRIRSMNDDVTITELSQDRIQEIFQRCKAGIPPVANSTLCMIKPHVVKSQQTGDIIQNILESGFLVKAIISIHMTLSMAEELIDIYRAVLPNYLGTIEQLCSGPMIALMITTNVSSNPIVEDFRDFCGPVYPELAKSLRPKSLRAVYGVSPSLNAIHCTDLQDDGEMECRYVFETLACL